jgi:folate-binding protein YgfZ
MFESSQRLEHLGCLRVAGADRVSFLQGQLSSDVASLGGGRAGLSSLNNRQGRAFMTTLAVADGDAIVLVMPVGQIDDALARLKMYVLRAKVELDAPGGDLPLAAVWGNPPVSLPQEDWAAARAGDALAVRLPGTLGRWLLLGAEGAQPDDGRWRFEDVGAALPQVYPATREVFLPQALNLDALGGISFDKGCYVGQEVIARLHFRGSVKRRMRLFTTPGDGVPATPGAPVLRAGETVGKVVDAAVWAGDGALLAVCGITVPDDGLALEDGTPLAARPLPYSLPED